MKSAPQFAWLSNGADRRSHSVAMIQPARSSVDLHCHSTASDGTLTPAELVTYASDRGVALIGLTDHDTTNGVVAAIAAGVDLGVTVLPGVELSSEVDGLQAHILGYFIDPASESLQLEFAWMNKSRRERMERIVRNLKAAGISIEVDAVFAEAAEGTVGRPHVARVLVANEYATSVSDAFERFLTRGKPGYAVSEKITPEGAIQAINRAGGVAVLAHPWSTRDPARAVARLAPAGLTGLECYYGEYAPDLREGLAELARSYNLIPTGGSDFHGPGVKSVDLGAVPVPLESVDALRAAAESIRASHSATSS
jgi:predicted metal-dependent phosphoesterase TrpH